MTIALSCAAHSWISRCLGRPRLRPSLASEPFREQPRSNLRAPYHEGSGVHDDVGLFNNDDDSDDDGGDGDGDDDDDDDDGGDVYDRGDDCYDCVGDVLVGLRAMGSQ